VIRFQVHKSEQVTPSSGNPIHQQQFNFVLWQRNAKTADGVATPRRVQRPQLAAAKYKRKVGI